MTVTTKPKHRRARGSGSVYKIGKVWWIAYRGTDGLRKTESTAGLPGHGKNKGEAERLLAKRVGAREHNLPVIRHAEKLTFDEAAQAVIDDFKANGKSSIAVVKRRIRLHLLPYFGGRRMAGITSADVTAFIAKRQTDTIITRKAHVITLDDGTEQQVPAVTKAVSNAEINRELQTLKRCFSLAIDSGLLAMRPKITMLRESAARSGFFEREPYASVLAHLPTEIRPVITFAYITGWRIASEVLPLEWRQVDFAAGEVRLDAGTTKNREGRVFPMTHDLRALLEAQHAEHERLKRAGHLCPNVFWRMVADERGGEKHPKAITSFTKAWRIACKAAGCPGRIPHDLRRTAVRNLVRAGIPERVAMRMTGHKTPSVFQRYNIVSDGDLREAVVKIDRAAAH
jgi:integrase